MEPNALGLCTLNAIRQITTVADRANSVAAVTTKTLPGLFMEVRRRYTTVCRDQQLSAQDIGGIYPKQLETDDFLAVVLRLPWTSSRPLVSSNKQPVGLCRIESDPSFAFEHAPLNHFEAELRMFSGNGFFIRVSQSIPRPKSLRSRRIIWTRLA